VQSGPVAQPDRASVFGTINNHLDAFVCICEIRRKGLPWFFPNATSSPRLACPAPPAVIVNFFFARGSGSLARLCEMCSLAWRVPARVGRKRTQGFFSRTRSAFPSVRRAPRQRPI
jgi:hypothetical protein